MLRIQYLEHMCFERAQNWVELIFQVSSPKRNVVCVCSKMTLKYKPKLIIGI